MAKQTPAQDERILRHELINAIGQIIRVRGLTQEQAAKRIGVDQPTVSGLLRGKRKFTSDKLMHFLLLLGCDIRVSVERAYGRNRGFMIFGEGSEATRNTRGPKRWGAEITERAETLPPP